MKTKHTIPGLPLCLKCIYWRENWTCASFPTGIPFEIAANIAIHNKSLINETIIFKSEDNTKINKHIIDQIRDTKEGLITYAPSKCFICKHRRVNIAVKKCPKCPDSDIDIKTCEAFPDGIPHSISKYGFEHSKPFPGDNGIQFELEFPD